jgi:methyl-accepting chemotaxis protein
VKQLRHLGIGVRLGLGFAVLIAASLLVAVFGKWQLQAVDAEITTLIEDRMVQVRDIGEMKDNANVVARGARNIALLTDEPTMLKEKRRIDDMQARNAALLGTLDRGAAGDDGRARLKAVAEARGPYAATLEQAVALGLGGQHDASRDMLLKEVRPLQTAYFKALDELKELQFARMRESAVRARQVTASVGSLMLAAAALAAVAGAAMAWAIARSITVPIGQAEAVARAVAAGDLGSKLHVTGRDETARLLASLKTMNDSLVAIVGQVRHSSDSIATGSGEIATGNADLSQRTEEQAANLQQAVATMEQLAATVKNSADSARAASQLASAASTTAVQGGEVVRQVVATMAEISTGSRRIAEITGVIDGIAFQTNILALNAAVEAARAGEQGRGFAVVASEVRMLAQRSALAAKEIKALIGHSVDQVDAGSRQVASAGSTMGEVVSQVQRVSDLIAEISAATQEQTLGIGQVTTAASQLDHVTQQNAALVEESAAAADSLKHQAGKLADLVRVFRLAEAPERVVA